MVSVVSVVLKLLATQMNLRTVWRRGIGVDVACANLFLIVP